MSGKRQNDVVDIEALRARARDALAPVEPAGPPQSSEEARTLMLSSRTDGGRQVPSYYLLYFLLVDLLGFPKTGQWEKVAWTVPIRYQGRLYAVEHRKLGVGIFAPNLDSSASMSGRPTAAQEEDAREIARCLRSAVEVAEPYFEWRAQQAVKGTQLNVVNRNKWLFERYEYFRGRYSELRGEAKAKGDTKRVTKEDLDDGTHLTSVQFPFWGLYQDAEWTAQAAIEAFFSWTEHAFIHLALLQGRLQTGEDVARLANSNWKEKVKAALDLQNEVTKSYYDTLLELRYQVRNFMAHGAFGKSGEAFSFHSGAGAVPVLLTGARHDRYSFTGKAAFDEDAALETIEGFLEHLWSGNTRPARQYLFSDLPIILTYVENGKYSRAMRSEGEMATLVEWLTQKFDDAENMDW